VTGFGLRRRSHITALMFLMAGLVATAAAQTACPDGHAAYGDIGVGLYQCVRANCLFAGRNTDDSVHVFNVEPTSGISPDLPGVCCATATPWRRSTVIPSRRARGELASRPCGQANECR